MKNLFALLALLAATSRALAVDPYAGNDPFWILLHEPAIVTELKLSPAELAVYHKLTDSLDLRFFPLRNQPSEQAQQGMADILAAAQDGLKTTLSPEQRRRLVEIMYQKLGAATLLRQEVAKRLELTETQQAEIKSILEATATEVATLQKSASSGEPREPLEKKYVELKTAEQAALLKLLSRDQQQRWQELLGPPFTLSKLGQPAIKAPELVDTGQWLNSPPLQLAAQRGKVVVVHFFTCICVNCIHNYPSYRNLQQHFADRNVVFIGIHTPEATSDRDVELVRQKLAEEKLTFPVVIDNDRKNWDAWGNSMWPSVYVLDKQGRLRHFWPGELQWQGTDGEKFIREQIENLLQN